MDLLKYRLLKNPWEKDRGANTLHTESTRMEFNWIPSNFKIKEKKTRIYDRSSVGSATNIWNKRATRKRFDRENYSACFITWCFLPLIQTRCVSRLNHVQRLIARLQRRGSIREKVPYLSRILLENNFKQISNRWGRDSDYWFRFCESVWSDDSEDSRRKEVTPANRY